MKQKEGGRKILVVLRKREREVKKLGAWMGYIGRLWEL